MAVTDFEQRTAGKHRDVKGAPGDELAIVEIAGVSSRRIAADPAGFRRGRQANAAVKRPQRNYDAGSKLGRHLLPVESQDLHGYIGLTIFRHEALATVVAVVDRERDRQDLDLQHIAGLCALYV